MHVDYFYVFLTLVLMVVGTVQLILSPQKKILRRSPKYALIAGVLLIIFLIVFNSLTDGRWDGAYIISILCFKESRHIAYLHLGISMGYSAIYLGCLQLLFTDVFNRKK